MFLYSFIINRLYPNLYLFSLLSVYNPILYLFAKNVRKLVHFTFIYFYFQKVSLSMTYFLLKSGG